MNLCLVGLLAGIGCWCLQEKLQVVVAQTRRVISVPKCLISLHATKPFLIRGSFADFPFYWQLFSLSEISNSKVFISWWLFFPVLPTSHDVIHHQTEPVLYFGIVTVIIFHLLVLRHFKRGAG